MCCGVFNHSLDILWCKQCECLPATWHCDQDVLCRLCKAKVENAPLQAEGGEDNSKRLRSASICFGLQPTLATISQPSASDVVCDTPPVVAPDSCGDHAPLRRCSCGEEYGEHNNTRCMYCNTHFSSWCCGTCSFENGWWRVCKDCFSRRQCACGSLVTGSIKKFPDLKKQIVDRCVVCHHYRAWICADCREAGFKRRVCNSIQCSKTVASKMSSLCPRTDDARADFELDKMMQEDKRNALKVHNVVVLDLGGQPYNGDWSEYDHWYVIVPRGDCTFGELRHILIHYYRARVPKHCCFNYGIHRADDELLPEGAGPIIFNSKPFRIKDLRPWSGTDGFDMVLCSDGRPNKL